MGRNVPTAIAVAAPFFLLLSNDRNRMGREVNGA